MLEAKSTSDGRMWVEVGSLNAWINPLINDMEKRNRVDPEDSGRYAREVVYSLRAVVNDASLSGSMEDDHDPFAEFASACRSCSSPIYWSITEKGKIMPVDREPVEDGNIRLMLRTVEANTLREEDSPINSLVSIYDTQKENLLDQYDPRYVSHFSSCPQSFFWRKK